MDERFTRKLFLDKIPNSQDLPDVLRINYGITIIERDIMKNLKELLGKPIFQELDPIEEIDVDTMFDFFIAETIFKEKFKNTFYE